MLLVLTIFGGYRMGHQLWTLHNQPFVVIDYVPPNLDSIATQHDTLDLSREVTPSFILGLTAAYFWGRHLGFQGEMVFLGMSLDSRCAIRRYNAADTADINPALCATLNGASVPMSAVSDGMNMLHVRMRRMFRDTYSRLGSSNARISASSCT